MHQRGASARASSAAVAVAWAVSGAHVGRCLRSARRQPLAGERVRLGGERVLDELGLDAEEPARPVGEEQVAPEGQRRVAGLVLPRVEPRVPRPQPPVLQHGEPVQQLCGAGERGKGGGESVRWRFSWTDTTRHGTARTRSSRSSEPGLARPRFVPSRHRRTAASCRARTAAARPPARMRHGDLVFCRLQTPLVVM